MCVYVYIYTHISICVYWYMSYNYTRASRTPCSSGGPSAGPLMVWDLPAPVAGFSGQSASELRPLLGARMPYTYYLAFGFDGCFKSIINPHEGPERVERKVLRRRTSAFMCCLKAAAVQDAS